MPTEARQISQGNFLIPDGAVINSRPMVGSISRPITYGSISQPIMQSGYAGYPQAQSIVSTPSSGYMPQVGEKQYPEGVPVGTLPFEVPPQPEDTPLTDPMCSALGVPRGTLWGGMGGVTVQQEV